MRKDFDGLRFNTAIARLMELTSHAIKLAADNAGLPRAMAEPLVLMVAPLAPHVAEDPMVRLGHAESLAYATFPAADAGPGGRRGRHPPGPDQRQAPLHLEVAGDADEAEIREH